MSVVTAQIVMRFAEVAEGATGPLLESVGLAADTPVATALRQSVASEAYYAFLERAAPAGDATLGLRYGAAIRPEDFGAMGLAFKTAATLEQSLQRLVRYIWVLTDSLGYALSHGEATRLSMAGRPHHRRGACIANEGALAAIVSLLRQCHDDARPLAVSFRHSAPASTKAHRDYFGCPVHFAADEDALTFSPEVLAQPTRLGDEGLSAYLLAQLDAMEAELKERSLETRVRRAIADALCDGAPNRDQVARRLGMSDRTLHRRLADEGLTFRQVAEHARREVAESLLRRPDHSLAEVAFLTGFSDQSAFHRAFKRWSGRTPQQFRAGA